MIKCFLLSALRDLYDKDNLKTKIYPEVFVSDRALIMKKKWLDLIFEGEKTWVIRGSNVEIRGKIFLADSESGDIVGECNLIDSKKLTKEMAYSGFENHRLDLYDLNCIEHETPWAWVITGAWKYEYPFHIIAPRRVYGSEFNTTIFYDMKSS